MNEKDLKLLKLHTELQQQKLINAIQESFQKVQSFVDQCSLFVLLIILVISLITPLIEAS